MNSPFFKRVIIVGALLFVFMKLGGFRLATENIGDQLLWCAVLTVFFELISMVIASLISGCSILSLAVFVLPWITFSLLQDTIFPGQFFVTTSGFVQIIVGFVLMIIWRNTK